MFGRQRRKYASMFGRIEHSAGRWLGFMILLSLCLEFLKIDVILHKDISLQLAMIAGTFICWGTYLFSHTLEKKIYGKHGFR